MGRQKKLTAVSRIRRSIKNRSARVRQMPARQLLNAFFVASIAVLVVATATAAIFDFTGHGDGSAGGSIAKTDSSIATDDDALKRYIRSYGVDETIAYIKTLPIDCHQRVHKVGRLNYELNGTKAFSTLNSECMSGYTHGVTEAYFNEHGTNNLAASLELICQGQQNGFYAHQCFHGIGHGLMAFNDYDLPAALKGCDTIPPKGIADQSCYTGVFMENVVGAITVGEAKNSPNTNQFHVSSWLSDDPLFPCNAIDDMYKNGCYGYQTSRMIQVLAYDYEKVAAACASIETAYQYTCFSSMGRDVSTTYGFDYEKIEKACKHAPKGALRQGCIWGASQDKFWHESEQDEALELCRNLEEIESKTTCYTTLEGRGSEIIASAENRKAFCAKYEEAYKYLCEVAQSQ